MNAVPAANGLLWIRTGWALFMRSPLMWILSLSGYWLLMAVLGMVPIFGPLIAMLLTPTFAVSFMVMSDVCDAGKPLEPALLFSGFRNNLQALITLGGIYLIAMLLTLVLANLSTGGALTQMMREGKLTQINPTALILPMLAYTLVTMAFWFAPILAAWKELKPVKALFFSFFACVRNWRAFSVYSIAWALIAIAAISAISLVTTLLFGSRAAAEGLTQKSAMTMSIAVLPVLFASFYASYRDIFDRRLAPVIELDQPPPPAAD